MKIYTRKGDDGTTGLFYGGRVDKDATGPEAYGTVDEAVAALAVARADAEGPLAEQLLMLQRQLFVVAAELATGAENRSKLAAGVSLVTEDMITGIEAAIDEIVAEVGMPDQFIVPGETRLPALLDSARAVIRRAERRSTTHVEAAGITDSLVVPYLNRLADLVYMLVRAAETEWQPSRVSKGER